MMCTKGGLSLKMEIKIIALDNMVIQENRYFFFLNKIRGANYVFKGFADFYTMY